MQNKFSQVSTSYYMRFVCLFVLFACAFALIRMAKKNAMKKEWWCRMVSDDSDELQKK